MDALLANLKSVPMSYYLTLGAIFVLVVLLIVGRIFGAPKATSPDQEKAKEFGHADAIVMIVLVLAMGIFFVLASDAIRNIAATLMGVTSNKLLLCHNSLTLTAVANNVVVGALFFTATLLIVGIDEVVASFIMRRERTILLKLGFAGPVLVIAVLALVVVLLRVLPIAALPGC